VHEHHSYFHSVGHRGVSPVSLRDVSTLAISHSKNVSNRFFQFLRSFYLSHGVHAKETDENIISAIATSARTSETNHEFEWVSVDDVFHDAGVLFETDSHRLVPDMRSSSVSMVYHRA
jgi:hypothetical protein